MLISVAIPKPVRDTFIYEAPSCTEINLGSRVSVSFGNQTLIGIVVRKDSNNEKALKKIKSIDSVLNPRGDIPSDILNLCLWAADYYHHPIGDVFTNALPSLLRREEKKSSLFVEKKLSLTPLGAKMAQSTRKISPKKKSLFRLMQDGEKTREELIRSGIKPYLIRVFLNEHWAYWQINSKPTGEKTPKLRLKYGNFSLNASQKKVVAQLSETDGNKPFLLQGITGSGKTEIYLRAIEPYLKRGRQALILVPEIGLTPQIVSRFETRFGTRVTIINSSLTDKQRAKAWINAKEGQSSIILGTRSAIFTPLKNLGIIIVDEEHDLSYKQQEGFRYSARDLAIYRSHAERIPIILGSATPSLESFYNAEKGRYKKVFLNSRPAESQPETYRVIDTSQLSTREGLTQFAIQSIEKTLSAGKQALVFINQRGFCPVLLCEECKQIATCDRCQAKLTYHQTTEVLSCHHCGRIKSYPLPCQSCGSSRMIQLGVGTERLEKFLRTIFPKENILRIDRDSMKGKNSMHSAITKISENRARILIGTQILAKGHHFPNITLVIIVNADGGFYSSDFRALERLGQTILQVGGRAGRGTHTGKVLIQTQFGTQESLQKLIKAGYQKFAKHLLQERNDAFLPPICHEVAIYSECPDRDIASNFLRNIKKNVTKSNELSLAGPIPAIIEKKNNRFRQKLILISKEREPLQKKLREIEQLISGSKLPKGLKWSIDVDPINML
ncbi:primosomal protein N' [Gammaproteobacteria bacterium]|nr:primosomal protein N' [Gammaproteobacteria bacterium]